MLLAHLVGRELDWTSCSLLRSVVVCHKHLDFFESPVERGRTNIYDIRAASLKHDRFDHVLKGLSLFSHVLRTKHCDSRAQSHVLYWNSPVQWQLSLAHFLLKNHPFKISVLLPPSKVRLNQCVPTEQQIAHHLPSVTNQSRAFHRAQLIYLLWCCLYRLKNTIEQNAEFPKGSWSNGAVLTQTCTHEFLLKISWIAC